MKYNLVFFNQCFDKKRLKAVISWYYKNFGEEQALRMVEEFKKIGFNNATQAGISIGLNDLKTPVLKPVLVSEAEVNMNSTNQEFQGARITCTEKSQRIVDTWHRASEILKKQIVDYFASTDEFNPVYIMALSGARGNFSQVRQLLGMRGLMADPQGQIISFPIRSNFREGLTLTEYFISCSGARKGLVDTALRTADTGYLTRRLVDVSHHVVVKRVACETNRGILLKPIYNGKKMLLPIKHRLVGRVLAKDMLPLAKQDQEITPELAYKITSLNKPILVRSPLTCSFNHEVCQLCYGWSPSQGHLVSLGEAVGVIAAQSIGEPGTQLTMRTFHTGGVFSGDLLEEIKSPCAGKIVFLQAFQGLLIRTAHGKIAFLTKVAGKMLLRSSTETCFELLNEKQHLNTVHRKAQPVETCIPFQALTMLFVRHGESVKKNQLLAEFSSLGKEGNQPIKSKQTLFADFSGKVVMVMGGKTKNGEEAERIQPDLSGKLGFFFVLAASLGATLDQLKHNAKGSNLKKKELLNTIAYRGDLVDSNYSKLPQSHFSKVLSQFKMRGLNIGQLRLQDVCVSTKSNSFFSKREKGKKEMIRVITDRLKVRKHPFIIQTGFLFRWNQAFNNFLSPQLNFSTKHVQRKEKVDVTLITKIRQSLAFSTLHQGCFKKLFSLIPMTNLQGKIIPFLFNCNGWITVTDAFRTSFLFEQTKEILVHCQAVLPSPSVQAILGSLKCVSCPPYTEDFAQQSPSSQMLGDGTAARSAPGEEPWVTREGWQSGKQKNMDLSHSPEVGLGGAIGGYTLRTQFKKNPNSMTLNHVVFSFSKKKETML